MAIAIASVTRSCFAILCSRENPKIVTAKLQRLSHFLRFGFPDFRVNRVYMRFPGRPLHANEQPTAALIAFVADQIDVLPDPIDDYPGSEQNRRRHAVELRDRLRLRPFGTRSGAELTSWLLPHAIENDRLAHLAELVMGSAGSAGSSSHGLERLNGSVSKSAIGHGGRFSAG